MVLLWKRKSGINKRKMGEARPYTEEDQNHIRLVRQRKKVRRNCPCLMATNYYCLVSDEKERKGVCQILKQRWVPKYPVKGTPDDGQSEDNKDNVTGSELFSPFDWDFHPTLPKTHSSPIATNTAN
ncbi:hypothetical protein SESBI_31207 [Sesbania bispinosa]|nr:hypothetical protein SESBI_31207 [Sesbania bispinosa]